MYNRTEAHTVSCILRIFYSCLFCVLSVAELSFLSTWSVFISLSHPPLSLTLLKTHLPHTLILPLSLPSPSFPYPLPLSFSSSSSLALPFRLRDDFTTSLPPNRHHQRDGTSSLTRKQHAGGVVSPLEATEGGGSGSDSGTRLSLPPIDDSQPPHLRPRWLGDIRGGKVELSFNIVLEFLVLLFLVSPSPCPESLPSFSRVSLVLFYLLWAQVSLIMAYPTLFMAQYIT